MAMMQQNDRFMIDHTRFIFHTNFAGDPTKDTFNSSARKASIIIPDKEMADDMRAKGYNVKQTRPRDDNDPDEFEPEYYISVTLKYKNRFGEPVRTKPVVKLINTEGRMVPLDEETVASIDRMRISDVRLVLSGYVWKESTGERALCIRTMYVQQALSDDPFASAYAQPSGFDEADDEDLPF